MKHFKYIVLFLLTSIFTSHLHAQVRSAKDQPHVLYVGVENNLDYILDRYDTSVIDLKHKQLYAADFSASSGKLVYYPAFGQLRWETCEKTADSVVIEIYSRKTQETIDYVTLRLMTLPSPSIVIANGDHKLFWGKKELYENNVIALYNAPKFRYKCKILSFMLQLQKAGMLTKELQNVGEKYNDMTIELMKQFDKEDTAYFSDFEVQCGCEQDTRMLVDKLKFVRVGDIIKVEREI